MAMSMQDTNTISIWNNGDGVPVEMHKEENVYVPELIFGHLLTSSNYDDDEKKVSHSWNSCSIAILLPCKLPFMSADISWTAALST